MDKPPQISGHTANREKLLCGTQNQGSDDIPEITEDEINNFLKDMKNNKSPGDDKISTGNIKLGGSAVLKYCVNYTMIVWNKSIIKFSSRKKI